VTKVGSVVPLPQPASTETPRAAFGRMAEVSAGKDTTTGHWEMMGLVVKDPFRTYPNGFPPDVIAEYERRIGRKTLGNKAASGTVILDDSAGALGLVKGNTYPLDLFHAERHTTASHFRVQTTLSLVDCGSIPPDVPVPK